MRSQKRMAIAFTFLYHMALLGSILFESVSRELFLVSIILGVAAIVAYRRFIKTLKLSKFRTILFKCEKILFLLEINNTVQFIAVNRSARAYSAISSIRDCFIIVKESLSYLIDILFTKIIINEYRFVINIGVAMYAACDILRNYITISIIENFFRKDIQKYYKSIIEFEKYYIRVINSSNVQISRIVATDQNEDRNRIGNSNNTSNRVVFFSNHHISDEIAIEHLKTNRSRINSKLIFCAFCDLQESNKMTNAYNALSCLNAKLEEKIKNVTIENPELSKNGVFSGMGVQSLDEDLGDNDTSILMTTRGLNPIRVENTVELSPTALELIQFPPENCDFVPEDDYESVENSSEDSNVPSNEESETAGNVALSISGESEDEKTVFIEEESSFEDSGSENLAPFLVINHLSQEEIARINTANLEYNLFYEGDRSGTIHLNRESFNNLKKIEEMPLLGEVSVETICRYFEIEDAKKCFRILSWGLYDKLDYFTLYENLRQINNDRGTFLKVLAGFETISSSVKSVCILVEIIILFAILSKLLTFTFPTQQKNDLSSSVDIFIIQLLPTEFSVALAVFSLPILWHCFHPFLFLMWNRPFLIGDRIHLETDNLIVQEIRLFYTIFERWNNEYVVMTNEYLKDKIIKNIRRSHNQQWKIGFNISIETPRRKIAKLQNEIDKFVKNSPAFTSVFSGIETIKDSKFILMTFLIKHFSNHQNGYFMWVVQNRFMKKLVEKCQELGISYIPLTIPIKECE